ncbi:MAG: MMPL family transporter, partial [Candidatus Omnitrophica bacterium]|nr:MMPL family transporter [Candidatus Omnitrophota bacterium]
IRIADKVLNEHFGGTYTAYLVLEAEDKKGEVFKEPRMLEYIENLQKYLIEGGTVGKSTSITDVVKKVYYELLGGDKINNVVPKTKRAVAQCLISYENSHKPDDLWHLTTPDFSKVNIWIQLKSGDNKDMNRVTKQVEKYFNQNTLPFELNYNWAGLTYINLVWQNKMVLGMLKNFLGSFIIVFFMMTFLFKSPVRGLISMIPLTVTILFIYSFFGFTGKDYDMPVAVLSALTLGLSIDFAIHFIQRARDIFAVNADENETINIMYRGPARAIIRNSFVIAIGFLPLLFASLVPYRTVGLFMFFIMFVSSMATLFILPAIMTVFPKIFFKEEEKSILCNCKYCFIVSIAVSLIIVYFLKGYTTLMLRPSLLISIVFVALMGFICSKISKIKICIKLNKEDK